MLGFLLKYSPLPKRWAHTPGQRAEDFRHSSYRVGRWLWTPVYVLCVFGAWYLAIRKNLWPMYAVAAIISLAGLLLSRRH